MTLKDLSASSQPHILHVPDFDDFISSRTKKTMTFGDHRPDGSTMTPTKYNVEGWNSKLYHILKYIILLEEIPLFQRNRKPLDVKQKFPCIVLSYIIHY